MNTKKRGVDPIKAKKICVIFLVIMAVLALGGLTYKYLSREEGKETTSSVTQPEETTVVVVFFNREGEQDCSNVFPTRREIEATPRVGRAALDELLEGPTKKEKDKGYITNIPQGVNVNYIRVTDGVATADFTRELDQVAGSCAVEAIRAQITKTLMQFTNVRDVIITVEGKEQNVLQP